jgi:antitoxin component of MazEF toxin-antitoxin module
MNENEFHVKKVHFEGSAGNTCGITIPRKMALAMGIQKGDYVKLSQSTNGIMVERMKE